MSQNIKAEAAEARTQETRGFMHQVRVAARRKYTPEEKVRIVLEGFRREVAVKDLCRRHNISSSLLYYWKKQYSRGKFNNEPTAEAALHDRIEQLERLVGKLTLENEFFKKGLQHSLNQSPRNGKSSVGGRALSTASGEDAV